MAKRIKMYASEAGTPKRKQETVLLVLSFLSLIVGALKLIAEIRLLKTEE